MEIFFASLMTFFSTLFGGLFGIRHRDKIHLIISFTAGVLIAVAFFDVIPEIFSITTGHNLNITVSLVAVVVGFFLIHILEKVAVIHSSHESEYEDHRHPFVGSISAGGLVFHSFLDGIGIGLGFQVSNSIGILIALAVIAHDFSDGLNTVSLLLLSRNSLRHAKTFLVFDAVAPVLGALSTFLFTISEQALAIYLGLFGGFLLYVGASDLLPEAHSKHSSFGMIGLTLLGVVFIFVVTRFL